MKTVNLVFPNQLFAATDHFDPISPVYLVEENLFFRQYQFHKRKLAFQRATMKNYEAYLRKMGWEVHFINARDALSDIRDLLDVLAKNGVEKLVCIDPVDDWLSKRITLRAKQNNFTIEWKENPSFINTRKELNDFFKPEKKRFFQTSFYKQERLRHKILVDDKGLPEGGWWTYDKENRKRFPKNKIPPLIQFPSSTHCWNEAVLYVENHFSDNPGEVNHEPIYPFTFEKAEAWLEDFLENRFFAFGDYEDAIIQEELILHHSLLSPLLNTGLLLPGEVIKKAINYAREYSIPINSLEGFIRQIMGWREFTRGVYEAKGVQMRKTNFWGFNRKIPPAFYTGETGIPPIDQTIKKILKTGYCHHIERLMVIGNFMLLCEFDPDEVYRWFMELFIDAYDWVMVPNVYGMSQFADGGIFATKPYISGSNYLKKMGDYPGGKWTKIWDSLFWRFIDRHRDFFSKNPRLKMMVNMYDKMDVEKQDQIKSEAENYLFHIAP